MFISSSEKKIDKCSPSEEDIKIMISRTQTKYQYRHHVAKESNYTNNEYEHTLQPESDIIIKLFKFS